MIIPITVLLVAAIFFAMGRVRSDIVALCALVTLIVTGVLTPSEALAGFSNPVVIMMAGLFVVGGAIMQTGLAKMISRRIMALAGTGSVALFLMVMLVTAVIGAFVSNTGTVALMMPIVVSIAATAKVNVRQLLMPLAFASSMGGMLTLIGTPPNLVIDETLTGAGYPGLSFFSFVPVGLVCLAVGIIVLLPLSRWVLSREKKDPDGRNHPGKSLAQLVSEYRLNANLHRLHVGKNSPLTGKSVGELQLHRRYGLTVTEVRRTQGRQPLLLKNVVQETVGADTRFRPYDTIFVTGSEESVRQFAQEFALTEPRHEKGDGEGASRMEFYDIGMAELVLLPASRYVGRQLRQTTLRANYSINVVGIKRRGEYILKGLADEKLTAGDVLLVQGSWKDIARLTTEETDWVVIGQPQEQQQSVTLSYKAPVAALIMVAMIAAMVLGSDKIAPVTAVMLAGILMVLAGCFRDVSAAYKTINWESIVLIAAMMPMSVALEKTGASALLSHTLVSSLGEAGPLALLAGIYFTTSLLTMFISNTATAVLMAPIALTTASELAVSPYAFLFAVTLGASMCFASPFATPPNALVMHAGRYSFMDYIKVGLPLQIIMGIVMILVLPLIFPL